MQVRHVGIVVDDLDKAIDFYVNLLGFEIQTQQDESGSFVSTLLGFDDVLVKTVKMTAPKGGSLIELLHFKNPLPENKTQLNSFGLTHVALTVDNVDALHEKLIAHGISFVAPPQLSQDKKAKVGFCKDPNGVFLELVELQ